MARDFSIFYFRGSVPEAVLAAAGAGEAAIVTSCEVFKADTCCAYGT